MVSNSTVDSEPHDKLTELFADQGRYRTEYRNRGDADCHKLPLCSGIFDELDPFLSIAELVEQFAFELLDVFAAAPDLQVHFMAIGLADFNRAHGFGQHFFAAVAEDSFKRIAVAVASELK